ncbi:hypothetical protein F4692_002909 [Nocardioides cavernae]|uniref:Ig-like domain repeat protein n=1 Tax=Nocardioides cavernae TaxID=1921566 RepID=A0A7Y9H4H4_9ACTN|nr:Ig-like domain repeat protein [Nocardioides cavernae]NYE37776.1 hypothetical protein [Nocardioides cavernae]
MARSLAVGATALVLSVAGWVSPTAAGAAPATSTTLVLSNPTSAYGQSVRASAAVASSAGPAQGDVVFTVDGIAIKANLTGGGTASVLLPDTAVGIHEVRATFVPQLPLQQEGSSSPVQQWRVERAAVDLGVQVSGARPRSAARVRLDLRGDFGTSPGGDVRLRLAMAGGPRRVRTATLDATARATVRLGRLAPGRYRLVATYAGDADHLAARRTVRYRVGRP